MTKFALRVQQKLTPTSLPEVYQSSTDMPGKSMSPQTLVMLSVRMRYKDLKAAL
jgi:hypothetical protein